MPYEKFNEVLSVTAHGLERVGYLLWPVMPKKMEQLLASLGLSFSVDKVGELLQSDWQRTFSLVKTEPLFVKPVEKKEKAVTTENAQTYITIEDLLKVHLVVGTIEECELVAGSDKLLKMHINFGAQGNRQILAGIRASYQPAELIGKQGIFVYNLKPRLMMGMESQGMMLVAEAEGGQVKMTTVAQPVPNGTRLR